MVVLNVIIIFLARLSCIIDSLRHKVVMITLGQVIAYGIDAGFANVHGGWRWMVGLGAVPAGLQLIFLFFLPESRESPFPYSFYSC